MRIIDPVIVRPWLGEWKTATSGIASSLERANAAKSRAAATRHRRQAEKSLAAFLERLRKFTVLDPACGSGNFLYLALHALHDLEHRVQLEAEAMGLQRAFPSVGPANVKGIELNAYAAELARVSVWIGEIQWMRRNGFPGSREPVLDPLETIECRDAVLTQEGAEPEWPEADVIIGNPPFLGGKLLITNLGEEYVSTLFRAYEDRVPREADLVCYWFVKAGEHLGRGASKRVGLVATNSIRGGANRRALERATEGKPIFDAWSDEPWVVDGAAVRVSLVCFSQSEDELTPERRLDGEAVDEIHTDLTARRGEAGVDLTKARRLARNAGVAFMGDTKGGPFDVPGELAREWLQEPTNPNGRPNSDVLAPWMNGMAVTRRPADKWIVDFGWTMVKEEAALYEAPFQHAQEHVYPMRQGNRSEVHRLQWWRHLRPRQDMWRELRGLSRYIVTPTVAKHRLFAWLDARVCPDHQLIVIAREDDTTFGILQSRFHEAWALRKGTSLEDRPRYTPTTTFETFPFPHGLSPDVPVTDYLTDPRAQAIASAARRLVELRDRWLNPPEWVVWIEEPVAGYPPRPVPRHKKAATALKKRTLTNLYNVRPQWLLDAQAQLDAAVAAAYGWPADITDEAAVRELLTRNRH
ncbi:class I SAM-dependent DNA methyltransferase [Candidatus Palauibacter sp.]|uniref:class I SAM-dependent DNA methyltransferase n=1 Tax=Candidatus Palauibacter sp. TaxID=3101350 RepID=UPI003B010D48